MKLRFSSLTLSLFALALPLLGQGLDPAALLKPPTDTWPTYNGDYSGRRFSTLTQINASNVGTITQAWTWRATAARAGTTSQPGFGSAVKATPLEVNGILYFSEPDNVWALDARTGEQTWHYQYPPNDGLHIGSKFVDCIHHLRKVSHTPFDSTKGANVDSIQERGQK